MATRATYQFISEWSGTYTAYIHHDGYPEGAAQYFLNGDKPIFNINAFIRANHRAEMTASHEIHGDTEYRYTLQGSHLFAQKRINFTNEFETIWDASIETFIGKYHTVKQEASA